MLRFRRESPLAARLIANDRIQAAIRAADQADATAARIDASRTCCGTSRRRGPRLVKVGAVAAAIAAELAKHATRAAGRALVANGRIQAAILAPDQADATGESSGMVRNGKVAALAKTAEDRRAARIAAYIRAGFKDTPSAQHNAARLIANDSIQAAILGADQADAAIARSDATGATMTCCRTSAVRRDAPNNS
jgi:hypothetical protein